MFHAAEQEESSPPICAASLARTRWPRRASSPIGRSPSPDARMLSKAWIVGLGMLLAIAVPATQELSGRSNSRPLAWVPAVLGLVGVGLRSS